MSRHYVVKITPDLYHYHNICLISSGDRLASTSRILTLIGYPALGSIPATLLTLDRWSGWIASGGSEKSRDSQHSNA